MTYPGSLYGTLEKVVLYNAEELGFTAWGGIYAASGVVGKVWQVFNTVWDFEESNLQALHISLETELGELADIAEAYSRSLHLRAHGQVDTSTPNERRQWRWRLRHWFKLVPEVLREGNQAAIQELNAKFAQVEKPPLKGLSTDFFQKLRSVQPYVRLRSYLTEALPVRAILKLAQQQDLNEAERERFRHFARELQLGSLHQYPRRQIGVRDLGQCLQQILQDLGLETGRGWVSKALIDNECTIPSQADPEHLDWLHQQRPGALIELPDGTRWVRGTSTNASGLALPETPTVSYKLTTENHTPSSLRLTYSRINELTLELLVAEQNQEAPLYRDSQGRFIVTKGEMHPFGADPEVFKIRRNDCLKALASLIQTLISDRKIPKDGDPFKLQLLDNGVFRMPETYSPNGERSTQDYAVYSFCEEWILRCVGGDHGAYRLIAEQSGLAKCFWAEHAVQVLESLLSGSQPNRKDPIDRAYTELIQDIGQDLRGAKSVSQNTIQLSKQMQELFKSMPVYGSRGLGLWRKPLAEALKDAT